MEVSKIQCLMINYKYQVALSFPGEKRKYVERVAEHLRNLGVAVFYDLDEIIEMWGKNLSEHLGRIYSNESEYVVMFISKEYVEKEWTNHERRHALSRMNKQKGECILPVRFDSVSIPGLPDDVVYLNANDYIPEKLAEAIAKKVKHQSDGRTLSVPMNPFREPIYNKHKPDKMKNVWLDVLSDKVTSGAITRMGGVAPRGVTEQYEVRRSMTVKVKQNVAQKLFDTQSDITPDYSVRSLFLTSPTHFGVCVDKNRIQERESIDDAYAEYPTDKAYSIFYRFHSTHENEHIKSCFELFIHLYVRYSFQQPIQSRFTYPAQGVEIHYSTETIFVAVHVLPINDLDKQLTKSCNNSESWTILAIFDSPDTHPNKGCEHSNQSFFREDWHGWSRFDKLLGIWYFSSICFSDLSKTEAQLLANPHHSEDTAARLLKWFRSPKPPALDFTD